MNFYYRNALKIRKKSNCQGSVIKASVTDRTVISYVELINVYCKNALYDRNTLKIILRKQHLYY